MWRALVLTLCFGLFACTNPVPAGFYNTDIGGSEFGKSLVGFKDHRGRATTLADYQGKAVILFFGYTSCPDACPTTLARLAVVMKQLGSEAKRVQVLIDRKSVVYGTSV